MTTPNISISAPPPKKLVLASDVGVEEQTQEHQRHPPTITVPGAVICSTVGFMRWALAYGI